MAPARLDRILAVDKPPAAWKVAPSVFFQGNSVPLCGASIACINSTRARPAFCLSGVGRGLSPEAGRLMCARCVACPLPDVSQRVEEEPPSGDMAMGGRAKGERPGPEGEKSPTACRLTPVCEKFRPRVKLGLWTHSKSVGAGIARTSVHQPISRRISHSRSSRRHPLLCPREAP